MLSNKEAERIGTVCRLLTPKLHGDQAVTLVAAGQRILDWKSVTADERYLVGLMLWAWCDVLEKEYGLIDPPAELAYRKLWGHDRRTMALAPYPRIIPPSDIQGLRSQLLSS